MCAEIPESERTEITGRIYLTETGPGKFDGLSLKACAPYGWYEVEYFIFDESTTSTVSGALGMNVFRVEVNFVNYRLVRCWSNMHT